MKKIITLVLLVFTLVSFCACKTEKEPATITSNWQFKEATIGSELIKAKELDEEQIIKFVSEDGETFVYTSSGQKEHRGKLEVDGDRYRLVYDDTDSVMIAQIIDDELVIVKEGKEDAFRIVFEVN